MIRPATEGGLEMPVETAEARRRAGAARPDGGGVAVATCPEPGERPIVSLEGMFSGHRHSARARRTFAVLVRTCDGRVCRGHTVDVSRGGALLALDDGRLFPPGDRLPLLAYAGLANAWLRDGFEVTFPSCDVRVEARLVRAVTGPWAERPPLLGCRFTPPLGHEGCCRLGIAPDGDA